MTTRKPHRNEGRDRTRDEQYGKGDKVTWKSHGSTAEGKVERKITKRTKAAGREVDASREDPQYEVRSAKSGKTAVHKPSALHRRQH